LKNPRFLLITSPTNEIWEKLCAVTKNTILDTPLPPNLDLYEWPLMTKFFFGFFTLPYKKTKSILNMSKKMFCKLIPSCHPPKNPIKFEKTLILPILFFFCCNLRKCIKLLQHCVPKRRKFSKSSGSNGNSKQNT